MSDLKLSPPHGDRVSLWFMTSTLVVLMPYAGLYSPRHQSLPEPGCPFIEYPEAKSESRPTAGSVDIRKSPTIDPQLDIRTISRQEPCRWNRWSAIQH